MKENDYNKVKPQKNSLRIRANIVKVINNEEHEESVSSEYDIFQKISKYDEFKYKELINEIIESKDKKVIKNNVKINKEKIEEKIIADKKKEKDWNNQQENLKENNNQISPPPEVHSPEERTEKSEIIEDIVLAPEDSPDPQNLDKEQGEEHGRENIKNYIGKVNKEELKYSPYQKESKEESIKLEEEYSSLQHIEEENEENHDKIESMDINEENNEMEKQEENIEDKKNYIYIENQRAENDIKSALESYEIEENIQEQNDKVNQVENEQHKEDEKEMVEEKEDEEKIEKQLEEYCEEQNKKKEQKIKVYNILENKNINTRETNDSDSLVVFLSSSVKFSKNKIQNYDEDDNNNIDNLDNDEMGPKNSIRNVS